MTREQLGVKLKQSVGFLPQCSWWDPVCHWTKLDHILLFYSSHYSFKQASSMQDTFYWGFLDIWWQSVCLISHLREDFLSALSIYSLHVLGEKYVSVMWPHISAMCKSAFLVVCVMLLALTVWMWDCAALVRGARPSAPVFVWFI